MSIGTPTDEGYDVLPAQTAPPDPDESLTLEAALADPTVLSKPQDPPPPLGRAPAMDFVQHLFIPNAAGAPLMLYGRDTLAQWVEKCLRTKRGANPACHPDFGVDRLFTDLLDGGPYDRSAAAEFQAIVERAMTVHPFIDSIANWRMVYTEGDDAAFITFTVIPVAQGADPLRIGVQLPVTGVA